MGKNSTDRSDGGIRGAGGGNSDSDDSVGGPVAVKTHSEEDQSGSGRSSPFRGGDESGSERSMGSGRGSGSRSGSGHHSSNSQSFSQSLSDSRSGSYGTRGTDDSRDSSYDRGWGNTSSSPQTRSASRWGGGSSRRRTRRRKVAQREDDDGPPPIKPEAVLTKRDLKSARKYARWLVRDKVRVRKGI